MRISNPRVVPDKVSLVSDKAMLNFPLSIIHFLAAQQLAVFSNAFFLCVLQRRSDKSLEYFGYNSQDTGDARIMNLAAAAEISGKSISVGTNIDLLFL